MSINEYQAASEAIDRGDIDQALHHINNLQMHGGFTSEVQRLQQRLWALDESARKRNMMLQVYGISCGVLGYGVLSLESPATWTPAIWGLSAFLGLPMMIGILSGNSVVHGGNATRFWRGFWTAAITMMIYTLVGMLLSRYKMESADKSADFMIFGIVLTVHGMVAGLVAGFSATIFRPKGKAA